VPLLPALRAHSLCIQLTIGAQEDPTIMID